MSAGLDLSVGELVGSLVKLGLVGSLEDSSRQQLMEYFIQASLEFKLKSPVEGHTWSSAEHFLQGLFQAEECVVLGFCELTELPLSKERREMGSH